ncbi:hypothetical protein I3J14_33720 [Streptomyces sp. HB-N217]|uniref:hypothetical protein n=1 Tax=Streptomyces sp. HB-N217 TaxID=2792016 RepID=UPI0018D8D56E|nr:hypothetical protein [Streptomyces sp. HB-N217]MBH5135019.1 hypothetical protein [Streptomyces sp. HB-N217]
MAEHVRQQATAADEEPDMEGVSMEADTERAVVATETDEQARQPAATATGAASEPAREESAADRVAADGARLRAFAEAAVLRAHSKNGSPNGPDARPKPQSGAERGDALRSRALARAAVAPSPEQRDLPLWTGSDLPSGAWQQEDGILHDAYGVPQWRLRTALGARPLTETTASTAAYEPVGLRQAFTSTVAQAWADIVPPEHGTVEDLLEAVDAPLRELEEQWRRTVPAPWADGEQHPESDRTGPVPSPRDPEPVDAALRQADSHAATLQDFPEWRRLQNVRGATAHLWNVLREQAGEYLGRLHTDLRFQGFWRTVSLRSAAVIGRCAQALVDRLRSSLRGDLPTAEALLKLSDAALTYSTPGIPRPNHPVPVSDAVANDTAEVRRLCTTLRAGTPLPYRTREEAVHASREIAEAFQVWRWTPMGRELTTSPHHPRVAVFRQAWQRLPAADLPNGPGTAAGPYGDVGRSALALVERAEAANARRARAGQPARFTAADVDALRAVATLAEHHSGRLAVTLPPGLTSLRPHRTPGPQRAAPSPRAVAPSASSARSPATARARRP